MRVAGGIAAPIVVATLVLAGCSGGQVSKPGRWAVPDGSAQADEPSATVSTSNERSGRIVISDIGDEVDFRCVGTGTPVILLEAGDDTGGTQAYGPAIIDPLAKRTTTCTYDRPGTGNSDAARGRRRTLASYRTDVSAFLQAADLRPPYLLVGQSGGGNLLISYAAAHADGVAGLVLIETYHDDPDRLAKNSGRSTLRRQRRESRHGGRYASARRPALPLGHFPVLVMTATDADPGNKENQAYWLGISPDSRQVVITGSHDLHEDDPARVTSAYVSPWACEVATNCASRKMEVIGREISAARERWGAKQPPSRQIRSLPRADRRRYDAGPRPKEANVCEHQLIHPLSEMSGLARVGEVVGVEQLLRLQREGGPADADPP